MKRIEAEMERTLLTKKQLAQKRGQDMGDDVFKGGRGPLGQLGIGTQGNVMGEIINLVDFYTENGIVETRHGNETSTSGKFYPVTALGENAVQPEMAEAMYRQFIVGGFTTQGKQAERYEKAAPTFGGILGLSKQTMQDISGSVGSTVYENFIENALRTKPVLDQQDMMFLANIQSKLNLPSSKAEQLMLDAQKKVLRDQAQKLFQSETVLAADVVSFRERCSGMGVDLASDLGISRNQIASLFVVEVKEGIEKGQITPDNSERLAEIQEGLGMSIEDGEQTLEGLVKSRVDESLDVIDKELMRGREASCIEHINALLKFAAFVDGDLNLQLKKQRANKILSIFSASDFKDVNGDVVDSQIQLLKQTLGISEN